MTISDQILHPSGGAPPDILPPAAPPAIEPRPEPIVEVAPVVVPPVPIAEVAPVIVPPVPVEEIPLAAEPEQPRVVVRAGLAAWDWTTFFARALNGMRTLLFFGVMGVLALGAKLVDVDLSGIVSALVGGKIDAADITVFMSISGIVLRFLTTTQVFARWRKAAQGDKLPEASAAVDEPDETN